MELEDQFGIKISDEDAQKITDRRTGRRLRLLAPVAGSGPGRARQADRGASRRAARAGLHASVLGCRPRAVVRAARVPGRQRLELAVARALYDRVPGLLRGGSRRLRSHVVSRRSCAVVARELGLARHARERGAGRVGRRGRAAGAEPNVLRGAARGRARRALPRARLRARSSRRSSRLSAGGSSTRPNEHVDHKTELQEDARARRAGR